jgi:hypothetical protein
VTVRDHRLILGSVDARRPAKTTRLKAAARRKQQFHFIHHTHGNSNFAVIDNFRDRLLGTYRNPDADDAGNFLPESLGGGLGRVKRAVRTF